MTRPLALAVLGVLALAGVAGAGKEFKGHFGDIDKNGDTIIVKEEFVEFFKDHHNSAGAFAIIDVDRSGGIDHDEWNAFKRAHGDSHTDDQHMQDKK